MPECPDFLSEEAKRAWWRIAPKLNEMGVLTLADEVAVELLCDAYVEYRVARDTVEKEGSVYETTSEKGGTMYRARPEVGIAQDAFRRLKGMMVEYGLTAASRSKLKTNAGDETDPLDEYFD